MLKVEGLSIRYGEQPVVEGVCLEVPQGSFVSLVGPSGSGKSSILRAIAGLLRPLEGTVHSQVPADSVGLLFQDDSLLPWRTAEQNVALGLRIRGKKREASRDEARQWLRRLGLAGLEGRFPHQLSGGQRKRVALAQVLALKPSLLLMDEPFASLDAILRATITQDLLRWVEAEGLSVLLVTHDLEEALTLSDRVYLLSKGPRARIRKTFPIPFPRPRDSVGTRSDPRFGRLLASLWKELGEEVGIHPVEPGAATVLEAGGAG